MRFQDKVVVILGGNSGIGLAAARAFVDGDHVTVHYHVRRWPGDLGWAVIDIFRIEDGMIAEHWDVMQDVVEGGPNPIGPF